VGGGGAWGFGIQRAFERADVLAREYWSPGELIALRHAVKNFLGRGPGLATVIRAVVDGNLVPIGYTVRFRGITGCLFLSEDLRRYRPACGRCSDCRRICELSRGGSARHCLCGEE
jgi:hypothetical protein